MRSVWRITPKDYPVSSILVLNILIGNTHSRLGFEEYETSIQIKFICDITTYLLHKSKLFHSFEGDYRRSLFAGTEIAYKDFIWYYQFATGNHNHGSHSKFWVTSNNFQVLKIYMDTNELRRYVTNGKLYNFKFVIYISLSYIKTMTK